MNTNCRKPFLKFWKILLFPFLNFIYLFLKDFIYLSERERERERVHKQGRCWQREKLAPSWARSWMLDSGLDPHDLSRRQMLNNWATQEPLDLIKKIFFCFKDFIYLFDRDRYSQWEREHKQGEWERKKRRSLMWGSIPQCRDHALCRRQTLNRCATQAPQ